MLLDVEVNVDVGVDWLFSVGVHSFDEEWTGWLLGENRVAGLGNGDQNES